MNLVRKFDALRIQLFDTLERWSKTALIAWCFGLTALIGALDYLSGDYSFVLFYLIPIFFAAWFIGRAAGGMICVVSFVAALIANPYRYVRHHYSHPSFYYWDLFLEFTYLILLSLVFSTLRSQFDTEREMSRIDSLTGALNRRGFLELASYEIAQCSRHPRTLSLALLDLDNFKMVNDRMGHAEGDRVLCQVVLALKESLRKADTIARLGGDEFILMLPETESAAAGEIIHLVRQHLLSRMQQNGWPVTFSIGLITHETPQVSAEEMMEQVDKLMYSIKNTHKNGIVHHVVCRDEKTA